MQHKPKSMRKKHSHAKDDTTCVKCPKEITAIARESLDGVMIIPPLPRSCRTNISFSEQLFKIETLFGPDIPFVLPKGRHMLHAKIKDVETGLFVRSCLLKYHVIVRSCKGYPNVKNKNLTMSCTAANIWGSTCAFKCNNKDEHLTHRESIVCSENLEWIGTEPNCTSNIVSGEFWPTENIFRFFFLYYVITPFA